MDLLLPHTACRLPCSFITLIFGTHRAHHNIQEHGVHICNLSVVRQWQLGVLGTLREQKRVASSSAEERVAVVCSKTYQNEDAHALQNQIHYFGDLGGVVVRRQSECGRDILRSAGGASQHTVKLRYSHANKHGRVPASGGFAYVLAWKCCLTPWFSQVTVASSRSRSGGTHRSSWGTLRHIPGDNSRDRSRPNRPNLLVRTGAQFYAQTIRASRHSPPSTAPASVWPRVQLQAGPEEAASDAAPRCGLLCPAHVSGLQRGKPGSPGSQGPSSLLLSWCTPIGHLPWRACLPLLPNTLLRTAYGPGSPCPSACLSYLFLAWFTVHFWRPTFRTVALFEIFFAFSVENRL